MLMRLWGIAQGRLLTTVMLKKVRLIGLVNVMTDIYKEIDKNG
jgi:hypothetical protein